MMQNSKTTQLQSLKSSTTHWLHIGNLITIASSLVGLAIAYSAMNSLAVTALGLVFIASLSLEVFRSNFSMKPEKKNAAETKEIKQQTSGRKRR
ncbi:MAG: hypothetical protein QXS27_07905 [Candidatus Jordarchaeaceae archaeon]